MKHPLKDELTEEISELATWMRERTSEELQSFVTRRYACVENEALD